MREATVRKFMRFKGLREKGLSINKALQGAGLSKSTYSRYKSQLDEILGKAEESLRGVETSAVENLEKKMDEVLARHWRKIVKLERSFDNLPILNVHDRFKCPECGARGLVAVKIRCTKCGSEMWWGYWPEKK